MNIEIQKVGNTARLVLNGRFDFNSYQDFNQHADQIMSDGSIGQFAVDFENVKYIDSSALGMLLLLKERATSVSKTVLLVNCKGAVYQALELGNFHRLFTIQ
ncbi:MAG: STAS domain-containing protein [Sulfuricella denitrificans]|nr:STAS domain-containing protein [Sulfuricella denitrificans]